MTDNAPAQITPDDDADYIPVVIYCRVSTDDKDQTNETQERVCREWCENHGCTVLKVYRDEESGMTMDRPGWAMMVNRIINDRDVDYIVAYDQSRITRMENLSALRDNLKPYRCKFRFVKLDVDGESMVGKIVQDVFTHVNHEENKIRNEKTKLGMETRKIEGKHVGRPARFMFAEDIESKPDGCFKQGITVVISEKTLYDYARSGMTLNYVAKRILGVSPTSLVWEMKERDPSNPKNRYKGVKDRYTTYITLYNEAVSNGVEHCKGSELERVGNPDETTLERVVE